LGVRKDILHVKKSRNSNLQKVFFVGPGLTESDLLKNRLDKQKPVGQSTPKIISAGYLIKFDCSTLNCVAMIREYVDM